MKRKRLLTLLGSVCLALMLALPLAVSCGPATPEAAAAEIAALELEIDELQGDVAVKDTEIAALEDEIAELRAPGEVYEWRFQHSWSPVDSHLFEDYVAMVREASGGRINMSVFSNNELVPREDVPAALLSELLDFAFFDPVHQMGTIPTAEIETVPFLWRSLDDFISIYYEMGLEDEHRKLFREEFDIHLIAILPDDFAGMLWADKFSTLADLKGRKISLYGATATVFSQFGIVPTWIDPTELYTSLATGLVDGVSYGGSKSMADSGFPEIAKYWMVPYYQTSWTPAVWMSVKKWEALPSDLQGILSQTSYSWAFRMRSYYAAADKAAMAQAGEQWGTEVVTLPEEDVQKLIVASLDYLGMIKEEHPEAATAVDIVHNALKSFGYVD